MYVTTATINGEYTPLTPDQLVIKGVHLNYLMGRRTYVSITSNFDLILLGGVLTALIKY